MEKHRDDGQIHSRPSPSSEKTCVVGKIYISSFNKYICVVTAATASGGGEELPDALGNLQLGEGGVYFEIWARGPSGVLTLISKSLALRYFQQTPLSLMGQDQATFPQLGILT